MCSCSAGAVSLPACDWGNGNPVMTANALPVIALMGRPNVGKSTLFNRLTRSRDALVADYPGLTRDRQYGVADLDGRSCVVVDTGGLGVEDEAIDALMAEQTRQALDESDLVLLVVDARDGVVPGDQNVADMLRRSGKPVMVVANKAEGKPGEVAGADFHGLGLGTPLAVSAMHGHGMQALVGAVSERLPPAACLDAPLSAPVTEDAIHIAVLGRPNVGKSTLVNRLLGDERVVTFDMPGTTRDAVAIPFERDGQPWVLIDTAGIRRRQRVRESIEKFSVVKALQAMEQAQVTVVLLDASEGVTDQDASLIGLAVQRGRALVLGVNKWDGLPPEQRETVRRQVDVKLPFVTFARLHYISALHGTGVGELFESVREAWTAASADLSASRLTRVLEKAVAAHAPPLVQGRRIKLRYAHQGGRNPPVIVIHGNQTAKVPPAYRRYLVNAFRREFGLWGTPLQLEFRTSENPFAGRRNTLSPRQARQRQRLIRHRKKGR